MKGLNWNEIIRSPCPASTLNEALLWVIRNRVSKRTIGIRTRYKPWLDILCLSSPCEVEDISSVEP